MKHEHIAGKPRDGTELLNWLLGQGFSIKVLLELKEAIETNAELFKELGRALQPGIEPAKHLRATQQELNRPFTVEELRQLNDQPLSEEMKALHRKAWEDYRKKHKPDED